MWTFRVAVVLGGRGVDANLRILQLYLGVCPRLLYFYSVIQKFGYVLKGGWAMVERVALLNCARKRRGVVQFPWELAEGSIRQTVSTFTALISCLAVL
ncbi:hypothetical protein Taro_043317 [Colocasia esculenta]|uniref:Uncharacterized protein n=1 Tax=Colocasia esculenta TaxID=4460 RepID=A0A843WRS8_COLES|nr:hypothetical protein [Colocasia esculenta]